MKYPNPFVIVLVLGSAFGLWNQYAGSAKLPLVPVRSITPAAQSCILTPPVPLVEGEALRVRVRIPQRAGLSAWRSNDRQRKVASPCKLRANARYLPTKVTATLA